MLIAYGLGFAVMGAFATGLFLHYVRHLRGGPHAYVGLAATVMAMAVCIVGVAIVGKDLTSGLAGEIVPIIGSLTGIVLVAVFSARGTR